MHTMHAHIYTHTYINACGCLCVCVTNFASLAVKMSKMILSKNIFLKYIYFALFKNVL